MTARARRMVGNAMVHTACAVVGLTGGFMTVCALQGWAMSW